MAKNISSQVRDGPEPELTPEEEREIAAVSALVEYRDPGGAGCIFFLARWLKAIGLYGIADNSELEDDTDDKPELN